MSIEDTRRQTAISLLEYFCDIFDLDYIGVEPQDISKVEEILEGYEAEVRAGA